MSQKQSFSSTLYRQEFGKLRDFMATDWVAILDEMPNPERVMALKKKFENAVKRRLAPEALELLSLVQAAYEFREKCIAEETDHHYGKAGEQAEAAFCLYIEEAFWRILDPKAEEKTNQKLPEERRKTLEEVRLWIIKRVSYGWQADPNRPANQPTERCARAFRFMLKALRAAELQKEVKAILQVFRDRTDSRFTLDHVVYWMRQPDVGGKVREILALARTRNGGTMLAFEDINREELLEPFKMRDRSEAAKRALSVAGEVLAILDRAAKEFTGLKASWRHVPGKIGESEEIRGDVELSRLQIEGSVIEVVVALWDSDPEELCQDIISRIRHNGHVWSAKYPKFNLKVRVLSGKYPGLNTDLEFSDK